MKRTCARGRERLKLSLSALAIASAFATSLAQARQDIIPGSRYTSARAASLGDAYLPLGDDGADALFYNPAVLGKLRSPDLDAMNLQFYGSSPVVSGFGPSSYKVVQLGSNQTELAKTPGVYEGLGAQFTPTYSMRGFALGVMAKTQVGAVATDDGGIRYRSTYQLVPAVGTGVRLAGGIVRLGYSLQWVNQAVGDVTAPQGSQPMAYNQGLAQGSALSHNVGGALTLPYQYLPSLNVVARNVATAHFNNTSLYKFTPTSTGAPANEPMTIDASISLAPKMTQRSIVNLVAEYRDATNVSQVSPFGHVALGMEYAVHDAFFFRGGWGSGYPNLGIGFRSKSGNLSVGWVAEDIGTTYHELTDRRIIFQYQVRAF